MIIHALKLKYEADMRAAAANIEIYRKNPAGIGEHPDMVAAVDSELTKLATAEDKLKTLIRHYPNDVDTSAQLNLFGWQL